MQRLASLLLLGVVAISAFFTTGCSDRTFKPSTEVVITRVEPFSLIPTATGTADLPTIAVGLQSLSKIPCDLKSYSVRYFSQFGEEIPSLARTDIAINRRLDAEEEIVVTDANAPQLNIYPPELVDLFDLSSAQISPVMAKITMHFYDVNGNWLHREASCNLYRYSAENNE